MKSEFKDYYTLIKTYHRGLYQRCVELRETIHGMNDLEELTDAAYALRDSLGFLEDAAKETRLLQELAGKIACLIWARLSEGKTIKTEFCSGTPQVKLMASIPKADTPEYNALMSHLGVPDEIVNAGLIRTHWPSFVEYLSRAAERGAPLPPGIDPDKTYPVYKLAIRKKKDIS